MGQKHSSDEERSSSISVRDDASDSKATKATRMLNAIDRKTLEKSVRNQNLNLAGVEIGESKEESVNSPMEAEKEGSAGGGSEQSPGSSAQPSPRFHVDNLILSGNPSIAELSHLTDLKMLRNFEDLTRFNASLNAGTSKDDLEEIDFRTISYERVPLVQLVGGKGAPRDSFTHTIDTRESSLSESTASFTEENDTCKRDWSLENTYVTLRERLSKLEGERDEARLELFSSEARCQANEAESRSLELSLDELEERLRDVAEEVGDAVSRGKELDQLVSNLVENGKPNELAVSSSS